MRAIDFLVFRGSALEDAESQNAIIKIIMVLERYTTAVCADGFVGYFHGYGANDSIELLEALREIDALTSTQIAMKSFDLFPNRIPSSAHRTRCKQVNKILASVNTVDPWTIDPWDAINTEFLSDLPILEERFLAYILQHRTLVESFPEDMALKKLFTKIEKRMN